MSAHEHDDAGDREAVDQAAAEAVATVALSYLRETEGRPLTRAQRDQADRAARLAAHWTRTATRKASP